MHRKSLIECVASHLPGLGRRGSAQELAEKKEPAEDLSGSSLVFSAAEPADVPAMVDMVEAALDRDPFQRVLESEEEKNGRPSPPYLRERREVEAYFLGRYVDGSPEMSSRHLFVARSPRGGEVVGFVGLHQVPAAEDQPRLPAEAVVVSVTAGGDVTRHRAASTTAQLSQLVRRHAAGRAHLLCMYLEASPRHRGQGISRRCLEHVLAQLRFQGLPILVWPRVARPVFRTCGWREVDAVEVQWNVEVAQTAVAGRLGLSTVRSYNRMPLLLREPHAESVGV